jgi:predicted NUDIX family NTP pyrophosphohydrolase
MAKKSAGILVYRKKNGQAEFLLAHPGGPFWAKKETGAWSVPKGEYDENEDALQAAKREFKEELGVDVPGEEFIPLAPIKQKSGKVVQAFAVEGDIDTGQVKSNIFPLEWPHKSGKYIQVPEIDRFGWFDYKTAKEKINPYQAAIIEELIDKLNLGG